MGGAGLYSLSQIVLFEVGPSDKPSLMGALVGITLAVSYVLSYPSQMLKSVLTCTYNSVPAGVVVVVALYLAWPPQSGIQQPRGWNSIRKIDFVGNFAVMAASALLVFALQEAGAYTYAWDSPVIVVTLSIAALVWVLFFTWEVYLGLKRFTHIEPIMPLRLFFRRVYASCVMYARMSTLDRGRQEDG